MPIGHIIAITLHEFQAWFNSGELRCDPGRLVAVALDANGKPKLDTVKSAEILDLIPHVDLEDEHNVLLGQLAVRSGDMEVASEAQPDGPVLVRQVYVPIRCLRAFYPLTKRGKQILASRLESFRVRVEEPLDEAGVNELWGRRTWRRVEAGGKYLLSTLIHDPQFSPSAELLENVRDAIEIKSSQKTDALASRGLVPNVLCYDRHKPIANTDIGYVVDLGVVLKERFGEVPEFQPFIAGLRTFYKENEQSRTPISGLLADPKFTALFLGKGLPAQVENYLVSLVLFLKWKYQAQKAGAVSCDVLIDDLKMCSGRLGKADVERAVWLFGAYCGFDKIAGEVYVRRPQEFAFVSGGLPHTACVLAEPPRVKSTAEEGETSSVKEESIQGLAVNAGPASPHLDGVTKPEPAALKEDPAKLEAPSAVQNAEKEHVKKVRKPRTKGNPREIEASQKTATDPTKNSELKLS